MFRLYIIYITHFALSSNMDKRGGEEIITFSHSDTSLLVPQFFAVGCCFGCVPHGGCSPLRATIYSVNAQMMQQIPKINPIIIE